VWSTRSPGAASPPAQEALLTYDVHVTAVGAPNVGRSKRSAAFGCPGQPVVARAEDPSRGCCIDVVVAGAPNAGDAKLGPTLQGRPRLALQMEHRSTVPNGEDITTVPPNAAERVVGCAIALRHPASTSVLRVEDDRRRWRLMVEDVVSSA